MQQSDTKPNGRKRRRWPWLLLLLIPVLLVGGLFLNIQRARVVLRDTYTTVKPTVGAISVTVYGSGSIDAGQSDSLFAPATGRAEQVLVQVGDRVSQGEVLAILSSDTLDARITQLESALATLDQQIAQLPVTTGSATIAAPVAGRIKFLYAAPGDPVVSVMDAHDALCVLSADGKMKIELSGANSVAPGAAVKVKIGGVTADGTVMSKQGGTTVVQLADSVFTAGSQATVLASDGSTVGHGALQVDAPVYVTGSSGIIKSVGFKVGAKVSKGSALFTLQSAGYSAAYLSLIDQRDSTLSDLQTARSQKSALTLTAPAAGIVETLNLTEKGQVVENQLAVVVGETGSFQMQVTIDEPRCCSCRPSTTSPSRPRSSGFPPSAGRPGV